MLALIAGYFGGWSDWFITRVFDLIAALPVILLGIALGAALAINGFHQFGPSTSRREASGSRSMIISIILVAYIGRPLRGQILSLREKEFVEASIAQGSGPFRVMLGELLPNIASSILVFFTLIIANNILVEAALSFLGAGVQPPNPSWGTLIAEGQERIRTAPWLTIVPGTAIVLTVVSLNIFGDGLRDALDPRAKVRIALSHGCLHRQAKLGAIIVLGIVSFITFAIFIVIPGGDPAERMAGKNATDENIANIRETWGFDEPFYVQYGQMMKKVFTADLISYTTSRT